jgi:hypothetical protein
VTPVNVNTIAMITSGKRKIIGPLISSSLEIGLGIVPFAIGRTAGMLERLHNLCKADGGDKLQPNRASSGPT